MIALKIYIVFREASQTLQEKYIKHLVLTGQKTQRFTSPKSIKNTSKKIQIAKIKKAK
jgi:hypothetical protein